MSNTDAPSEQEGGPSLFTKSRRKGNKLSSLRYGRPKRTGSTSSATTFGRSEKTAVVEVASHAAADSTRSTHSTHLLDLDWYPAWLSSQLANLPPTASAVHVNGRTLSDEATFDILYAAFDQYSKANPGFSIVEVVDHLRKEYIFTNASDETLALEKLMIFAMLGWKSMLYMPALNICPPDELAVHKDASQPDSGLVFDTYKVSTEMCDRPLFVLLKSFGNLLPARSINTAQAAVESSRAAASWTALYPANMNAYLLHSLLNVRFRWVDMLALHLDYDKSTRTLSLFSFPSICASQLLSRDGAIFAFASKESQDAVDPRADEDDIAHFLQEVLLSFRLLFGQSPQSRRLFRQIFDPGMTAPFPQPDTLLSWLCTQPRPMDLQPASTVTWMPSDRHVYYAARDFPVLYERVELIARELNNTKPRSLGGLLRDRRDTLQFWTFWLVFIIGGISILLSVVQVTLQAVQLSMDMKKDEES